jgi:probable rRNA maturation factor
MSRTDSCVLYRVPARGLSRRGLRDFARQLQAEVAGGRAFCCLLTDDAELRRLNRQFRKKDYATDVLSFPVADGDGGAIGELAISWDRAKAQAAEYGHSAQDEVRILMLHGVLHLTGMDHEKDGGKMARSEVRWRKRLNLPAGLIERVAS